MKIPDPIYDQYYFSSPENQEAILRVVENLLKEEHVKMLLETGIDKSQLDIYDETIRKEEREKSKHDLNEKEFNRGWECALSEVEKEVELNERHIVVNEFREVGITTRKVKEIINNLRVK